jgi:phosphatidylglycerophosphatase A
LKETQKLRLIKKKIIQSPEIKVDIFSKIISSGFFVGYIPFASGTFGSLFALLFLLIPGFYNYSVLIILIILLIPFSIITSNKMVPRYGDDPSVVVIDEILGMWITLLINKFLFEFVNVPDIIIIGICFVLFRIFDIVKIYPANYFDKLKSGFGIIMDDVISGIYAGLISYPIILIMWKLNIH